MNFLVMDDEFLARDYMKEMIEEAAPGNNVYTTDDPDKAMELLGSINPDVVFLDINMPQVSGIDMAKKMKLQCPRLNIIFATGYDEYTKEAFDLDASAYLMKPVTVDQIEHALDNLRYSGNAAGSTNKKLYFQCFGNFEAFWEGQPIQFRFSKTKELLAYLVHRNGALSSVHEIEAVLWEDEAHSSYFRKLKKDLLDTLKEMNIDNLIVSSRGYVGIRLIPDMYCDYYSWLKGEASGINAYRGEYMAQYEWGEFVNASLSSKDMDNDDW